MQANQMLVICWAGRRRHSVKLRSKTEELPALVMYFQEHVSIEPRTRRRARYDPTMHEQILFTRYVSKILGRGGVVYSQTLASLSPLAAVRQP